MKLPTSHKTLFFIGILAQAVAIDIEHAKEETERASSLRGFKSDHIEKLHWTTNPHTGYRHWNNGHGQGGRDRNGAASASDYSLTEKELLDTALASIEAATRANELANAAAANDFDAVKEALGKLDSAAYLAKEEAELACAFLPSPSETEEEEDKKLDIDNYLQNLSHVEAIANAIAQEAQMTSAAAEQAIVAIHAAELDKHLVSAAVFHTKSKADNVASKVQLLIMLMIGNAGPNEN